MAILCVQTPIGNGCLAGLNFGQNGKITLTARLARCYVAVQTIRQGIDQMVAKRFFHPAPFFRTWLALRVIFVTVPMGMAAPGDRIPGFAPGEHFDLPFPGVRGRVDGFLTSPSRPPVIYGNFREGILGLSSDGSLETKRAPSLARAHCKSAVMLSDGRMVAAGAFKGNWGYAALVRFLPDMRLDPEFRLVFTNTASIQSPERALEQPDGRLLIGGRILEVEGHPAWGLVRLFSDGSLDRGFAARLEDRSSGHPVVVEQMALQRDGRILVAGSFDSVDGLPRHRLARLMPDGRLDESFASTGEIVMVNDLHQLPEGGILVAGAFVGQHGGTNHLVLRLLANGELDPDFALGAGVDRNSIVRTVLPNPDGSMYAAGRFRFYNGVRRENLAHLLPDGSVAGGLTGIPLRGFKSEELPEIRAMVRREDGTILLGGQFAQIEKVNRSGYAAFSPAWMLDVNYGRTGPNSPRIPFLVPAGNGRVFAHGSFFSVNGAQRAGLAKFLEDGKLDESFDPGRGLRSTGIVVRGAPGLQSDGRLIHYGYPGATEGSARIVRMNQDGSLDPGFNAPPAGPNLLIFLVQPDDKIILGGALNISQGVFAMDLVRLLPDGAIDENFQPSNLPPIKALELDGAGRLLAGGEGFLIRLLPDGTRDPGFSILFSETGRGGLRASVTGEIRKVVSQSDGKILVSAGTTANPQFARLLQDGSLDPDFAQNSVGGLVRHILIQSNGRIVVGGKNLVSSVRREVRRNLVRIFPDGTLDLGFDARLEQEEVDGLALDVNGDIWASLYLPRPFQPARPLLVKLRGDAPLLRVRLIGTDQVLIGLNEMPGRSFILETSADLVQWEALQEFTLPAGGFLEMPVSRTQSAQFIRVVPSSFRGGVSENLR